MRSNPTRQFFCVTILLLVTVALPASSKNSLQVVVVPVANMYSHPSDKADVVSQAMYGNNVTLLVKHGKWSRIQTSDRYQGWVRSRSLRRVEVGNGYATSAPAVQVESIFANVYAEPDVTKHKPVVTLPFEVRLEIFSGQDGNRKAVVQNVLDRWLEVWLPEKHAAWIQASDVVSDPKPLSIPESIELAKRFLGLPYLWGGRSSFGFDCSGFTQMLVRVRGVNMPRDADQQAAWNGVAAVERKDLEPGDLVFFGSSLKDITHTGMYVGDGQFIHDSTTGNPVVQIGHLDDQPWTQLLMACRRVKQ